MSDKPTDAPPPALLEEGRNCQAIRHSRRAAVVVDVGPYFAALAAACSAARHQILILGWDFERRERLFRDDRTVTIGGFFDDLVRSRPGLRVHALIWDFAMIYALERDLFPVFHLGLKTHRRFRFHLDSRHPVGASHHQKVVVVDDRVAFSGGIDLGRWRWDTPEHRAEDPRRVTHEGESYPPFHDVQMLVDGEAAAALGDLARTRWRQATGEELHPPPVADDHDPWPPEVTPRFHDVDVGIARTLPELDARKPVREVESLWLDAIEAACDYLYIENQYFTSETIADALAARLAEPEGPEILLVMPSRSGGWLEERTMDSIRSGVCRKLQEADAHGRLLLRYPAVPGLPEKGVKIHAKLMVSDDRLLRVGSANLTNRSMGLDSECDLIIDAAANPGAAEGVADTLHRLLGEHLGVAPARVAELRAEGRGLREVLEALGGGERTLRPLPLVEESAEAALTVDPGVLDPEHPIEPERLVARYIPEESHSPGRRRMLGFLGFLALLLAMAAAWRWTPLSEWVRPENITAWVGAFESGPVQFLLVVAGYVVGGFMMLPVTVMVAATSIAFGPWTGFAYSLTGAVVSALAAYGVGQALGRDVVRRLAGARINRISRSLARRGVVAVIAIRMVPVAPFTVVNIAAGASHIRFGDFVIGTVLGLLPGVVVLTLLATSLLEAVTAPSVEDLLLLLGAVAIAGLAALVARRWLKGHRGEVA
jgi:phosphatidylserine/phosphatidylglycerophosphate/cardiolipin synthase-like enzyme/uncharacterized membrane protein YdjX (TVP38/TMEM64 family)